MTDWDYPDQSHINDGYSYIYFDNKGITLATVLSVYKFKLYFIDISEEREEKIDNLLNENM